MIGIIDYGAGNIHSVQKALLKIGFQSRLISTPEDLTDIEKLILPGVGSFGKAADKLRAKNFIPLINSWYTEDKPLLGICLGMQLLMENSEESKDIKGISIIKGKCRKLTGRKVPHMGWNEVYFKKKSRLFNGLEDGSFFYFVHSYYLDIEDSSIILGETEYENQFPSVIESGSFTGMQFHPEKSGINGLRILENWIRGE